VFWWSGISWLKTAQYTILLLDLINNLYNYNYTELSSHTGHQEHTKSHGTRSLDYKRYLNPHKPSKLNKAEWVWLVFGTCLVITSAFQTDYLHDFTAPGKCHWGNNCFLPNLSQSTNPLIQDSKNSMCEVAQAIKFCTVAPNICGSSVWNLLHVTLLEPRVLKNLCTTALTILPFNIAHSLSYCTASLTL
jgi:hypothetical protein